MGLITKENHMIKDELYAQAWFLFKNGLITWKEHAILVMDIDKHD